MPQYRRNPVYEHTPSETAEAPSGNTYPGGYAPSYGQGDGGLQQKVEQWLDLLSRRKWLIFAVFVLVTAWGVYSALQAIPMYQAGTYVLVDLMRLSTVSAEAQAALQPSGAMGRTAERSMATELFIIQNSRMIEDRVTQRLKELHQQDGIGVRLRGKVTFSTAGRGVENAMLVQAESPDPKEAALLANLYAEEYVAQTQDYSRSSLASSRKFLEKQEEEQRQELRKLEDQLEAYKQQNASIGLTAGDGAVVERMAELEANRDQVRIELQMRKANLAAAEKELESIHPQLAKKVASDTDTRLGMAQQKLAELEASKEQALLASPGMQADAPELAPINRQIQSLKESISTLSKQYVDEVMAVGGIDLSGVSPAGLTYVADLKRQVTQQRIEIGGLEAQEKVIERQLDEHQEELRGLPQQQFTLARLERSRNYAEQMLQYIVRRLQEVEISEQSEPGYARILRPASVPMVPEGPGRTKDVAKSLLMGLLLGIGLAVVRDKLDNRIYKPEELRRLGYRAISVIPDISAILKEGGKGEYVENKGRHFSKSLVALLVPMSAVAEAYRALRTSIQFSRPDEIIRTILVTSSAQAEGKSTTAVNLAVVMAQSGRRTLIIDADLHRPRQNKLLDAGIEPGLLQLLFSDANVEPERYRTAVDDLYLLPTGGSVTSDESGNTSRSESGSQGAGISVSNPSELLGSKRMRTLLAELKDQFDIIVIDAPPVLAVTDASLVSTQCDATLVVVRSGVTKTGDLQDTFGILADVGARVIGTVMNGFDVSRAYGYAYRYRYNRYYKYGGYAYSKPAPRMGALGRWWAKRSSAKKVA